MGIEACAVARAVGVSAAAECAAQTRRLERLASETEAEMEALRASADEARRDKEAMASALHAARAEALVLRNEAHMKSSDVNRVEWGLITTGNCRSS